MGEATFGKYRLIAELGHGGMADVFLAVMAGPAGSGFSKLTVIKRLRQNLAEEPEFVEMLVDEARISARLNHPNVVQTNEVGSVGNQYFLAMEYLDGQPLHRIQHRAMQMLQKHAAAKQTDPPAPPGEPPASVVLPSDPFPKECQYLVVIDTLAGLGHAHELADYDGTPLEIVHRDVTPHNIFVTYEGQVKVVDFGIAKAVGRASETRQGVVKGKVRYMAPEQAIGQKVDRRADLFSVGIMLWEAATGRRLWKDMDDLNIVQALVSGAMKISPREVNPDVPEEIDRICRKALAYSVADRYDSAEEFRLELEQYVAETGKLVAARKKLAAVVSTLFTDKRLEIKAVIEKQLAQLMARGSGELRPATIPVDSASGSVVIPVIPPSGAPARSSGAVTVPVPSGPPQKDDGPTSITNASAEFYAGGKKKRRGGDSRLPIFAAGAILVVATLIFAGTRTRLFDGKDLPVAAAAAPPEAAAEVRVKISTNPPGAVVSIDGVALARPTDTTLPRDRRTHVIRVEAPGYDPYEERVRLENDLPMAVVLQRTAAAPKASASAVAAGARWAPPPPPPTPPKPGTPTPHDVPPAPPVTNAPTTAAQTPSAPTKAPKPNIDSADPWANGGR